MVNNNNWTPLLKRPSSVAFDEQNFSVKKAKLNQSEESNSIKELVNAFEQNSYENFVQIANKYFLKNCNDSINDDIYNPYRGATPLLLASLLAKKNPDLFSLVRKMVEETPHPDCDATMIDGEYRGITPLYIVAEDIGYNDITEDI